MKVGVPQWGDVHQSALPRQSAPGPQVVVKVRNSTHKLIIDHTLPKRISMLPEVSFIFLWKTCDVAGVPSLVGGDPSDL